MLSVVNSILIATIILVLIYVLLNIKNELTAFKGIYNKEQDYKHTRLQKTFGELSSNDEQLKGKADEHSTSLESHDGRLTTNETKLAEHDTTLSVHDTKLIENRTIIDSNQNLLRNSDNTTIQDIVANNPDVSENDVYSLIGHNNTVINDNYNSVFEVLEKNVDNTTLLKSVAGTKVRMDTDGNVKINVTNPDKLQVCDINGENCSHLITRRFIEQLPIQIPDNIENFEENPASSATTSVDATQTKLILNEYGELCGQKSDGQIDPGTCKKIGLLGELQGPPGPQGTPGGAFSDLTDLEKAGLKGNTGPQGPQGVQGEIGPQGLTGPKGDKGDPGVQGPSGPQGNPGNTGIQGPKGDRGRRGRRGRRGTRGSQGIPGTNSNNCTNKNECDKLCINNTCINETDLKKLKGTHPVYITHYKGRVLQGKDNGKGNARFANTNKGSWERMYLK